MLSVIRELRRLLELWHGWVITSCKSNMWLLIHVPNLVHCSDVIMSAMASQITSITIVYWTVSSGANQRKHYSSPWQAFVWGIHRLPMNSPHKGPVTRKMFSFDDVIMSRGRGLLVTGPYNHHGTCLAHVPWCMPGSLTSVFLCSQSRGRRSRHSRGVRNPQFYVSGKRPMKG